MIKPVIINYGGGCESAAATGGCDVPEIIVQAPYRPSIPGSGYGGFGGLGMSGPPFQGPYPAPPTQPTPKTATGGVHKRPPPIPPSGDVPIGEPPPSEPPYATYDPDALKPAKPNWIERLFESIYEAGKIFRDPRFLLLANATDMGINLATYSTPAGLDAEAEAQRVRDQLEIPILDAPLPSVDLGSGTLIRALSLPNPFNNPDYQPDPYAEPTPAPVPYIVPNPAGLPYGNPFEAPLPEVRVIGQPFRAPGLVPNPMLQPYPFPEPGTFPAPQATPRATPIPRAQPFAAPRLSPYVPKLARPFLPVPFRSVSPLGSPDVQPEPRPIGRPTKPDTTDCQCTKSDKDKDKKKRKKRTVCHEGTYIELSNGLLKYRRKEIPCR